MTGGVGIIRVSINIDVTRVSVGTEILIVNLPYVKCRIEGHVSRFGLVGV